MTVFVVEDDVAVRESLVLFLRQTDIVPVAYASAEEFLHSEIPGPSDTVLVDIGLPGMSGSELIGILRQRCQPPRIVVITGKSRVSLERDLLIGSETQLLRKPIDADSLVRIFPDPEPGPR